jgi:hypothetical protein
LTDNITNGVDIWDVGLHLLVNLDKAPIINIHTSFFTINKFAIRRAPDRD